MDYRLLRRLLWMHRMSNYHSKISSLVPYLRLSCFLDLDLMVIEIYRIVSSKALDQQGDPSSRPGAGERIVIKPTTIDAEKKNGCC
jgi:hypothetical protein